MLRDTDLVSIQEVRAKVERSYAAFQKLRKYTQAQLDNIVEAMGAAARANAKRLAEAAVEETGYGNVKDKIAKNMLNADLLVRTIRGVKTIGVIGEVAEKKLIEIGVPVGVIAAILPTTNPTSSAIYKSVISLKAGNTIVISPHPRAKNCTCQTADVLYRAALEAGAPEDSILCVQNATMEGTDALMRHPRTSVILATGGAGIVKAAYSSGKPAFGVGPGNVPVLMDRSAPLGPTIAKVVEGKSFDYGTVCSSEQTLVAPSDMREAVLEELRKNRAYLCTAEQAKVLGKLLIAPNWRINANCVGQSPQTIAKMAGFEVPAETSILVVEIKGVGKEHPLSMEKLSPVLSVLFVNTWEEQLNACQAILKFGGLGHTSVIHSTDDARIREYGLRMPSFRVLVNTPSPQGSTGITTGVQPSMTLGCGAMAGNATSDNVGPLHLVNVKRVAYVVRTVEEAFPPGAADIPVQRAVATPSAADLSAIVVSAVEKYLSARGIGNRAAAPEPKPAAPSSSTADVVDRFLRGKGITAEPSAAAGAGCGCSHPPPANVAPAPAAKPAEPPAPPVEIVDFVCEADVRAAMNKNKKIYTGPKTIVTPSARELGNQHGILIQAQR